jgi:hypothetical protein
VLIDSKGTHADVPKDGVPRYYYYYYYYSHCYWWHYYSRVVKKKMTLYD